jgi:maltose O-acetyltransferase
MFTLAQCLLHLLAEGEALFIQPGSHLPIRRRELKKFGVSFGKEVWVGRHLHVYRYGGIALGERCALGDYTQLVNHSPIEIGDNFISANGLIINSGTHDPVTMTPRGEAIRIGNRVWCGLRVTILAGVTIGNDVVVGAGSVVNKDVPSNSIVAGVPARVIRQLNRSAELRLWTWAKSTPGSVSPVDGCCEST